jgi:hypothetical protein
MRRPRSRHHPNALFLTTPLTSFTLSVTRYWAATKFALPVRDALPTYYPPAPPHFEEDYNETKEKVVVTVGKVSKTAARAQKDELKARLWNERERALQAMKAKEEDLQVCTAGGVWVPISARSLVCASFPGLHI